MYLLLTFSYKDKNKIIDIKFFFKFLNSSNSTHAWNKLTTIEAPPPPPLSSFIRKMKNAKQEGFLPSIKVRLTSGWRRCCQNRRSLYKLSSYSSTYMQLRKLLSCFKLDVLHEANNRNSLLNREKTAHPRLFSSIIHVT